MAESKSSFINQILDSFARDLGFKNRLSEMGDNIKNTFKDIKNTLNGMSLDGVRKFLQENVHGGSSVSSATAAQRMINDQSKKGLKSFKEEQKLRKSLKSDMKSQVSKPKDKSKVRTEGSAGARDRAGIKTVKKKNSVKKPVSTKTMETAAFIKRGDTLSAIARRYNTTVAALMRINPQIKDKNKIKAGNLIRVGKPEQEAFRKKEKQLVGTSDPARTIAEAKRRGLTTYTPKGSKTPKAAVTAEELKKSGLTLRENINKMKKKKMNMGGMMAAVGSSAANKKRNTATGLSGMKGGGMTMKKKGYAKGGMMKKKGYSKGGAMPMGKDPKTGKMMPKFAMDGKGKMAKGGMMKKKGYAKGGASRRGR